MCGAVWSAALQTNPPSSQSVQINEEGEYEVGSGPMDVLLSIHATAHTEVQYKGSVYHSSRGRVARRLQQ